MGKESLYELTLYHILTTNEKLFLCPFEKSITEVYNTYIPNNLNPLNCAIKMNSNWSKLFLGRSFSFEPVFAEELQA